MLAFAPHYDRQRRTGNAMVFGVTRQRARGRALALSARLARNMGAMTQPLNAAFVRLFGVAAQSATTNFSL
jgi:hypothetical protein